MKNINRLVVSIALQGNSWEVGELARQGKRIFFKYYPSFLDTGLQLSPFKLPLSSQTLEPDVLIFDGLFGLFHDSLPDGWGRLLIDRSLLSKGIAPNELSPLERLSFVGNNGKGALCYRPAASQIGSGFEDIQLDLIAAEAQKVLSGADSTYRASLASCRGITAGIWGFYSPVGFSCDCPRIYFSAGEESSVAARYLSCPSTKVRSTLASSSSSSEQRSKSLESTTMSATRPGASCPLKPSSKAA